MITEDYVSFETAKLLKEKGFKGQGEHFYEDNKITNYINYWPRITPKQRYEAIEAPTLQMAMKWLRKMYDLYIMLDFERPNCIEYKIYKYESELAKRDLLHYNYEESYEEACEAAIKYCLTNLI